VKLSCYPASLGRMEHSSDRDHIGQAARACAGAAFARLAQVRVIPTSQYHPFIRAGRDYYGVPIMEMPEFKTLEGMLNAAYPERFSEPLKSPRRRVRSRRRGRRRVSR
jgi:hypothetical protein